MATHHGKEGVIKVGSDVAGEVTGFTLETTGDVVEDTQLSDAAKSYIEDLGITKTHVSLADESNHLIAFAVLET